MDEVNDLSDTSIHKLLMTTTAEEFVATCQYLNQQIAIGLGLLDTSQVTQEPISYLELDP